MIKVSFEGETNYFSPVEISAMVLSKLKETAETFLGEKVESAVITVPAYFNDSQRQATRDAGTVAGLNVLRIISEPAAAAIAYGLDTKHDKEQNVLVFDLGGGTFDASILSVKDKTLLVKSTTGDIHLGGGDFDHRLVEYVVDYFKREHGIILLENSRAYQRLRYECEKAKRTLSTETKTDIRIVFGDEEFICTVSQATFEELNKDIFQSTIKSIQKTLKDANLTKKAIDEIVLVGGSTRIPKIQQLLQKFFDGKKLNETFNADEAVVCGAAMLAASLTSDDPEDECHITLFEVSPLPLGIEIGNDQKMSVIIPQNTIIPTEKMERYVTKDDNQTIIRVSVYEGEHAFVKDNNLLGEFKMYDIKPSPAGEEKIDVTFQIDSDGILTVTAVDIRSGNRKNIEIRNRNRLSEMTIKRMVKTVEKYKNQGFVAESK